MEATTITSSAGGGGGGGGDGVEPTAAAPACRDAADEAAAAAMAASKGVRASSSDGKAPLDEFTRHADEILPFLWLGSEDAGRAPVESLRAHGITHVLVPADTGQPDSKKPRYEGCFVYLMFRVMDMPGFPIIRCWPRFVEAIESARAAGGIALCHCASGVSRSAATVIAYLMWKRNWDRREASAFVRARRPQIKPKFDAQLDLWGTLLAEKRATAGNAAGAHAAAAEKDGCRGDGDGEHVPPTDVLQDSDTGRLDARVATKYKLAFRPYKECVLGQRQTMWPAE